MNVTDIFIRRPVLATVVSLLILLVGARSLQLLNVREYPETTDSVVTVRTAYPGADAQLVKGFITSPLEEAIATSDGIDFLESTSIQGISVIQAHIELNYDPYQALTQISAKVDQVRSDLPEESEEPTINVAVGETTATMYINFHSEVLEPNQITDYLNRVVQPKLNSVSGVQEAEILGGRPFALRAWLKPDKMAAVGVTPSEVFQVLEANNHLAGVGRTKGTMVTIRLRADTSLESAEQFRQLVVKRTSEGTIRLEDVAEVELGAESYDSSVIFQGNPGTFVGIQTVPTANPLTVIEDVRNTLPDLEANYPGGLEHTIVYDATEFIEESISEVEKTLIEAFLIVVVVIFLFLGSFRAVAIPVIAVPLSLIGTGFLMFAMGYSLNVLTLLAMVLAIGLVVDDAIIVVENIHRHIENGERPFDAAIYGARELAGPIVAMSLTLVAVFAPIGFMGGVTGTLFSEFAYSLAGAVVISGVVALTLSPMMASRMLKADTGSGGLAHFLDKSFEKLRWAYERLLHRTLNYLSVGVVFGLAVLASCYFLFVTTPSELAPDADKGSIFVLSTGAPDATLDQTELFTNMYNPIFESFPATDVYFNANGISPGGAAQPNSAFSILRLKPWSKRDRTAMEIKPILQGKLGAVPGLRSAVFIPPALPGSGSGLPVQFVIGSTDEPQALYDVSQQILQAAQQSGLFVFTDTDLKYDQPQARIQIDRDKVADLGLTMRSVGSEISSMLGGAYVNRFSMQGRAYQVIPQVERVKRLNPEQLLRYHINTPSGEMIPLSTVVSLQREVQPEQLHRFQQLNSATISAIPAPGVSMGRALDFLESKAQEVFPQGYSIDYAGQSRKYVEEGQQLVVTFFLALVLIFLMLAALYESWRDPLVMLISVPMSIAGALVFLSLGFATMNIYTQIGLVTLIGVISKHGILIVQFANQLQIGEGFSKRKAIEDAAGIRLRPILMTTAALVLAVIPLIMATGAGAQSRYALGLVIATGLSIGTLFTLFVVPTMYMVLGKDHGGAREEEAST
ncbi:efflux RND transporter permease subunit [Thiohalorhabdus methylotrophus]|uniref:Efflux RND transporter permease subunit n=1 Tax=Thiohalorhabdus methylotrophus TaxID=3242694 RepID=A0ABV4TVJ4_9GAMM